MAFGDPTGSGGSTPDGTTATDGASVDTVVANDEPTVATPAAPSVPDAAPSVPSSLSGPGPLRSASASSVDPAMLTVIGSRDITSSNSGLRERPKPLYARNALSPLPYMVVALVGGVVAVGLTHWALEQVSDPSTKGISQGWWTSIYTLFVGYQFLGYDGIDVARLWVAVGAMAFASVLTVLWIRRIGVNNRADTGMFGGILVVAALFSWWAVPLTAWGTELNSRGEARLRATLALVIFIAQVLLARWSLVHKIWRGARLPIEPLAMLLWVPAAIATGCVLSSTVWTVYSLRENGSGHSKWEPTETMIHIEQLVTRATGIGFLALLIVASVRQHMGVQADRRVEEEWSLSR